MQVYPPPAHAPSRAKPPALGAPGTPQRASPRLCPDPPVHPPAGPVPRVPAVWLGILWGVVDALHPVASLGGRHLGLVRGVQPCPCFVGFLGVPGGWRGGGGECRRGFSRAPNRTGRGRAMGKGARGGVRGCDLPGRGNCAGCCWGTRRRLSLHRRGGAGRVWRSWTTDAPELRSTPMGGAARTRGREPGRR